MIRQKQSEVIQGLNIRREYICHSRFEMKRDGPFISNFKREVLASEIMSHHNQVFIPVTDEIIFDHPEKIEGPLVPYSAGMECQNWLTIEINPDESKGIDGHIRSNKPKLRLV